MPPADLGFLQAILADPDDDTHRLVYADWLEERGDGRARFLRADVRLAALADGDPAYAATEAELRAARAGLDRAWLAAVGKSYDLYLEGYPPDRKIHTIKVIREVTDMGLAEATRIFESVPCAVFPRAAAREELEQALEKFARYGSPGTVVSIRPAAAAPDSAWAVQARAVQAGFPDNWLPDGDRRYDVILESCRPSGWDVLSAFPEVRASNPLLTDPWGWAPHIVLAGVSRADALRGWAKLRPYGTVVIRPAGT
jgi:uncharacterized protein (TIGR02996 family)